MERCGAGRTVISSPPRHLTGCFSLALPLPSGPWPIFLVFESSVSCFGLTDSGLPSWLRLSTLSGIFFIESFHGLAFVFPPTLVTLLTSLKKHLMKAVEEGRLVLAHSSRSQSITAGKAWGRHGDGGLRQLTTSRPLSGGRGRWMLCSAHLCPFYSVQDPSSVTWHPPRLG